MVYISTQYKMYYTPTYLFDKRTEIFRQDTITSSRCVYIGDAKCTTTAGGVLNTCLVHHRRSFAARASYRTITNRATRTWTRAFMESIVEQTWASRSGGTCTLLLRAIVASIEPVVFLGLCTHHRCLFAARPLSGQ